MRAYVDDLENVHKYHIHTCLILHFQFCSNVNHEMASSQLRLDPSQPEHGMRKNLKVDGNVWKSMETCGSLWTSMEVYGKCIWKFYTVVIQKTQYILNLKYKMSSHTVRGIIEQGPLNHQHRHLNHSCSNYLLLTAKFAIAKKEFTHL